MWKIIIRLWKFSFCDNADRTDYFSTCSSHADLHASLASDIDGVGKLLFIRVCSRAIVDNRYDCQWMAADGSISPWLLCASCTAFPASDLRPTQTEPVLLIIAVAPAQQVHFSLMQTWVVNGWKRRICSSEFQHHPSVQHAGPSQMTLNVWIMRPLIFNP